MATPKPPMAALFFPTPRGPPPVPNGPLWAGGALAITQLKLKTLTSLRAEQEQAWPPPHPCWTPTQLRRNSEPQKRPAQKSNEPQ